ncbi:MAG TPA: cysteine--tRNA ligase [Anaerolineales bacterium]|nr:cysteine--tRNA ligase [Anaerolineales bacterium]
MQLYNPLTQSLEPLCPDGKPGDIITIYVCGITPYDTTHLGHAFTYTTADVLIRYLEYRGSTVKYVQNVTDIDDDILKRAKNEGGDWREVGNRWTRHFIQDMINLNVRPPDHYPRATEVIPEIIETVQALIDKGVGYEKNGSVYYHVDDYPQFGALARMDKPTMLKIANERGNNPDDPNKRDPLDFVLWQAHTPGEPSWESPWGAGRPGWHIECSTMSSKFLGVDTIDIHGGGGDLLFPHHTCEIAQIEPLTGKPFVRFWMHAAMVRHGGEKMSKSLGNLVWARELLKTHTSDALRLYLATHHFQVEWSYDSGLLNWAGRVARRLMDAVTCPCQGTELLDPAPWVDAFHAAMDDNLDSPSAIGVLDDLAVQILLNAQNNKNVTAAQATLCTMSRVFGLTLDVKEPETRVKEGWQAYLEKFQ